MSWSYGNTIDQNVEQAPKRLCGSMSMQQMYRT